ncbi:MAG: bifunctional 2',3'-cyclic-nucleotide 2'-phosphodiesterase/3'-nucleotidase [Rhodobacterales bacterium]|nr:MAG: bifunctional 2',3'-cyclic-nucleotide 2'-phosphodiesterase/3'-nucleotidase [Rhodobacterales bacterium]
MDQQTKTRETTDTRPTRVDLRILATGDLHMHLQPPYYFAEDTGTGGLVRTAALIRQARDEAQNAVLFDSGDFLHGTPVSEELVRALMSGNRHAGKTHPIVSVMNKLGYDAITLGNHEFDHGAEFLGHVLRNADFPIVCTNLSLDLTEGARGSAITPVTVPYALLHRKLADQDGATHDFTIGLLGLLPPGSITGLRRSPYEAVIRDMVPTTRQMVPMLRALGADAVVVLAHSGIGPQEDAPGLENAILPLAAIPGIDAIVAGHDHKAFPNDTPRPNVDNATGTIHGTPVVNPGFWGSHLGVIDLCFEQEDAGWTRVKATAEARPVAARNPDTGKLQNFVEPEPEVAKIDAAIRGELNEQTRAPIGQTAHRLHSYFAKVAPSSAVRIVQTAARRHMARTIANTTLSSLPMVVSSAPFKCGGLAGPTYFTDIAAGPVTSQDIGDIYPFPNELIALRLLGSELSHWLERAASIFNQIEPGKPGQALIDIATPAYYFESIDAAEYEIDLTQPARFTPHGELLNPKASRIRNLTMNGAPIRPRDEVLLVTSSFRLMGGGNYPVFPSNRVALDLGTNIRDVLTAAFRDESPFGGDLAMNWRLAPAGGASVRFTCGPRAAEVIDEFPDLHITPGEIGEDGFMEFTLKL